MSDSYNANIYLKPSDLNNIEDRIEELTEECQERIFGKENNTYSGTDFQIDTHDVIQGDLTKVDGHLTQTTSNGINKFDFTKNYNSSSNNVEVLSNGLKLINTSTNTYTFTRYIIMDTPSTPNKQYCFSATINKTGNCQPRILIGTCDSSGGNRSTLGQVDINTNERKSLTITTPSTITSTNEYLFVNLYTQRATGGTIGDYVEYTDIQFEEGSSATSYVPYDTGYASPSPDHPQPINVVSGRQVVSVAGKNVFDTNKTPIYTNSVSTSTIGNGIRVQVGTAGGYRYAVYILGETSVLNGKTIRVNSLFSASSSNSPAYALIYCDENGGNRTNITQATTSGNTISATIGTTTNTHIAVSLYANSSSTSQATGTYADFTNIMVTTDNEDMTYEEYKGNNYEINLGKNLINIDGIYSTSGSSFIRTWENGVATLTWTSGFNLYLTSDGQTTFTFDTNETYTFSFDHNGNALHLRTDEGNTNRFSTNTDTEYTRYSYTFTGISSLVLKFVRKDNSGTAYLKNFQIEKGSSASSYSPYKTPIYLGKIGTYQDYIIKTSGKNLLPPTIATATQSGITLTNNEDGSYTLNGTATANYTFSIDLPETLNGTYSISCNNPQTSSGVSFRILDSSSSSLVSMTLSSANTIRENVSITNGTKQAIRVASGTQLTNFILQPMLNEGATALPYEPYGTGQWYIHKEIGKVVLTGASGETWAITGTNPFYRYRYLDDALYSAEGNNVISNQFSYNFINATNENIGISISLSLELRVRETTMKTLADWKTWLITHPLEVYYVLNTPTNTLIEDEELISQLNSIQLISGLNNIIVSSSNLSGIITIQSYLASFYRNIEVGDDLGGKTLYLSLPRTIHESIPDTDTSSHPLINMDGDAYIVYRYVGGYKYIGVRLPDPDKPNNHIIYYFYGYSTANQKGNPYLNHIRYTLPKNFGKVRAINKNHDIFKYIKIYDEKLIPNYEKHTWVDNEQVTMQKIDHIEKGVNNIGLYYEKPTGWVNEKEWLPTANKTYHSNYGVGVKTISYQDLNRWYNNLDLIDFNDLNEITVWNAVNDISQIEWNGESDEEWVDNFNLVLYDFTTEDNNTLITENGDTMLVLVNERV